MQLRALPIGLWSPIIACLLLWCPHARAQGTPPGNSKVDNHGDVLPENALSRYGTIRFFHDSPVRSVAFSPNGHRLASIFGGNSVFLWETVSGAMKLALSTPAKLVLTKVSFSPTGKYLAAADDADGLWIWTMGSAQPPVLLTSSNQIKDFAFLAGDDQIVVVPYGPERNAENGPTKLKHLISNAPGLGVWDITTCRFRDYPKALKHTESVVSVGSAKIAHCDNKGMIQIVDLSLKTDPRLLHNGNEPVTSMCASGDGSIVSALIGDGVMCWDVKHGTPIVLPNGCIANVSAHAIARDGSILALRNNDSLQLIDLARKKILGRCRLPDKSCGLPVAVSADGKRIAAPVGNGCLVRIFDSSGPKELPHFEMHTDVVTSVHLAVDGRTALSIGGDRRALYWDTATSAYRDSITLPTESRNVVAYPGGDCFAFALSSGGVVFDARTGKEKAKWIGKPSAGISISPNGRLIAVQEHLESKPFLETQLRLRLLDAANGSELVCFEPHRGRPGRPVFSSDSKLLATGGAWIELRNVQDTRKTRQIVVGPWSGQGQHIIPPSFCAVPLFFSPDGKTLVVSSGHQSAPYSAISAFDCNSGTKTRELPMRSFGGFISHSHDCRFVALNDVTDDWRNVVIIREWPSCRKVCVLDSGRVSCLSFSIDGKTCISGSTNGMVMLWRISREARGRELELDKDRLGQLWEDLAKKQSAIDKLVDSPKSTIPFLAGKLQIQSRRTAEELLMQLESSSFNDRTAAMEEITALEFHAKSWLEESLHKKTWSAEARRRIQVLLGNLNEPESNAIWMSRWNSVNVLEQIGTREACRLLEVVSKGPSRAKLTLEAAFALERVRLQNGIR